MRPSPFKKQRPEEVLAAKVRLAAPPPKVEEVQRDGLEWLIKRRKAKVTPARQGAAWFYRDAFRAVGGVPIASTLGSLDRVDSSARTPPMIHCLDASSTLFILRSKVLCGQDDMLTVMDGVIGLGHTLRALAGGDDRLAGAMEQVLYVALDLVENWRLTNARVSGHLERIPIRASADRLPHK